MQTYIYSPIQGENTVAANKGAVFQPVQIVGRSMVRGVELAEIASETLGYLGEVPASELVKLPGNRLTPDAKLAVHRRMLIAVKRKAIMQGETRQTVANVKPVPDDPVADPRPAGAPRAAPNSHRSQSLGFRAGTGGEREAAAVAALKRNGPPERLGKAQTRQRHRKPAVIGDDIALAHNNAILLALQSRRYDGGN